MASKQESGQGSRQNRLDLWIKIPGIKKAPAPKPEASGSALKPKPEEKKDPKDQNKEKPVPVEEKPIYDRSEDLYHMY